MNPVSFSVKRPVATTVFYLAILVIGLFSLAKIGVDLFPPVEFPFVSITTVYRGASPADIETLISKKIEDTVSEIDGIRHISSLSMEDVSQVFIEFEMSKKLDAVAQDVREKIDLIKNELPDEADAPIIQKLDLKAKPIMNLVLSGGDRNMVELYTLADEVIKERLSRAEGVASVDILGGQKREILIAVDQDKLAARHLSLDSLIMALNAANLDVPGGHITQVGREYTLRVEGEFDTVAQMRQLYLTNLQGEAVPITDVCTISDTHAEQRMMTIINGQEGIGLSVKKRADANVVAVVKSLREKIAEIQQMLPAGVRLEIINDDSDFIMASINDVRDSIIIGIALTTLVLFLFLHNVWLTIIAALTMPISIIATFILLRFAGFTFNMMSLMALGLAVGVLVDNAIVVLENIFNFRQKNMSAAQAAEQGAGEIALAVAASTMTNLVVFLPIAFMSGIIEQFFRQFGLTTIFVTLVSLAISFTLTPMLYAVLTKREKKAARSIFTPFYQLWDRGYEALAKVYGNLVSKSLQKRWLVVVISLGLFFASTRLVPFIGSEFITQSDKAELSVSLELPPGTPLEKTRMVMNCIDRIVKKDPAVQKRLITLGMLTGGLGKNVQGPHVGQMLIKLSDKTARQRSAFQIQDELRAKLRDIPEAIISIGVPNISGGSEAPLQIEISGDDFAKLEELATKIVSLASSTPGTTDVTSSWKPGKPQVSIYPDRIRIKDLGLSVAQVALVIRTSVEGSVASKFRVRDKEYDMRVKLTSQQRQDISQIRDFKLFLPTGGYIPLSQVTRIEKTSGPASIIRKDKQRVIIVSANLTSGAHLGDMIEKIKAQSASLFHGGYRLFFAGQAEHMAESFGEIFSALILAVILTYLVMAALLESFLQPLAIIFTFPLAMIGVWGSLFLTGMTFSLFSLMAIVMLVGYVVNVAILILDYTAILKGRGMDRNAALAEACRVRLRPILMTTLTTIFGMLPLALAIGWGAETRAPMAVVFIGGMIASTLMTLFVIPVVSTYMEDVAAWPGKLIQRIRGGK